MTLIRPESAHAINGVAGRMHNLHRPPAPWKVGTFASQKWVSESRPIAGYGRGAYMNVFVRFDDDCKNGHNTFAITADVRRPGGRDIEAGGCMHEDIAKVFPELAHLIRWHLCSTDGPMHYVANTVYHAKNQKFDSARSCACWPEATDAELSMPAIALAAALNARLPALLSAMRADIEAAGFMWLCPAE